jgi:hypothetical protein
MSETWTEYAVQTPKGGHIHFDTLPSAATALAAMTLLGENECKVVGRQVTASDWLPVDTDGAK